MHWSKTNKREEVIKKLSVGWTNLIPQKKLGENRECLVCRKTFYVKRAYIVLGGGKYCSKGCVGKGKRGIIPKNIAYARSRSPIKIGNNLASLNTNEKHWNWKGSNVGYYGAHAWLKKNYGKAVRCENQICIYPRQSARGKLLLAPKTYQWANISRKYKRDRSDFMQLCASCHKKFDLAYSKQNVVI